MEHAVHRDGERLLSVLESTVRDLELIATLPEKEPTTATAAFQSEAQEALHRQVNTLPSWPPYSNSMKLTGARCHDFFQFVVEASLLHFIALQRLQEDERPETLEDSDDDDDELQQIDTQSMLSGPVATRLFPKSLHQVLKNLKVRSVCSLIPRK